MPDEIIADAEELIEVLEINRDRHRSVFLKAQDKYRERVIAELDAALKSTRQRKGSPHALIVALMQMPEPQDHTGDYDREIKMLKMHTEPKITVTRQEAEQYIMDQWHWSPAFAATAQAYGVR